MATNTLFKEAKKLRAKHPHMYNAWTDYVKAAARARKKTSKRAVAPKKSRPAKKGKVGKAAPAAKALGTVAYHKSQARKQLEEQLAWMLLARDQATIKSERNKLTKKVRLKRIELNKLK